MGDTKLYYPFNTKTNHDFPNFFHLYLIQPKLNGIKQSLGIKCFICAEYDLLLYCFLGDTKKTDMPKFVYCIENTLIKQKTFYLFLANR